MEIKQNLSDVNFTTKLERDIKYIVIHYTGNKGDTAYNNTKYFKSVNRNASAHYFVDKNSIWQCVKDNNIAWHCGASSYKHDKCRNANSIGIELCSGVPDFDRETVTNAAELVRMLMKKYNIGIGNVIRHFDVTGKACPKPFLDDGRWQSFKELLKEDSEMDEFKKEYNAYVEHTSKIINTMGQEIQALKDIINVMGREIEELRSKG